MRAVFFLREALNGLFRSSSAVLLAAVAMVLAALALAVFVPLLDGSTAEQVGATGSVKLLAGAGAALLGLGSVALIGHAIQLSIHARHREVEVMRLVGATNWFIRWPFLLEGVIVGLAGGAVATAALALTNEVLLDPTSDTFAVAAAPQMVDFPLLVALVLVTSVALAAIGTGIVLRRFVRV